MTAKPPVVYCKRCGREVRGQSGDTCSACEKAALRQSDDALKRQLRVEREAAQKREGGRPWKYW
jgi:hypothetical protein